MSSSLDRRKHDLVEFEGVSLGDLLRDELMNTPLAQWGFFFPCQVATWRYISERYPGRLGELNAGYDDEPWFAGQGAEWFCGEMVNDVAYLDAVEAIMYAVVARLPESAKARGFLRQDEVPELDPTAVDRLERAIVAKVT